MVDGYKLRLKERELKVKLKKSEEGLPKIMIDAEKMRTAVRNIFDNAVRYTLPGGKISIALKGNKKEIEVQIQDTSLGIPRNQQEKIFTKFFRGANIMKIDTEGSELEILKSIDFSQYTFLYINIEHNYIEPRRTEIKTLLLKNGYLYKDENKWDDEYIHETTIIGIYYYNQDYTKPIIIKRLGQNNLSVSSQYWDDNIGTFNNCSINWQRLGKGKIFHTHIDYGNKNIWHRDERKNILFI